MEERCSSATRRSSPLKSLAELHGVRSALETDGFWRVRVLDSQREMYKEDR